jgi:hypothetical protein
MMRAFGFAGIALVLVTFPSAGEAQLLSDSAEGLSRLCVYAGTANVVSRSETRTLRVGIGENCPFSYPAGSPDQSPAPPTAQLQSETVTGDTRACVYEQAGSTWTLRTQVTKPCPLFAGVVAQAPGRSSGE